MKSRLFICVILLAVKLYAYPVFEKIEDKTFYEGDTISFVIKAYAWQYNPLEFTFHNEPEGAKLNYLGRIGGCTCSETVWGARFTFAADFQSSGEYHIIFTVTDMYNATHHDTMILVITDVPYAPSITSIPDTSVVENDTLRLDLNQYVIDLDNGLEELSWDVFGYRLLDVTIDTNNIARIFAPQSITGIDTVYLTVTDPSHLSDTAEVRISIQNSTHVHEVSSIPRPFFSVYPNPFSEQLFIDFKNNEKYSIRIYNILGQLVYTSQIQNLLRFSWEPRKQYSHRLQSGTYIIYILCKNKKFIKRVTFIK